MGNESKKNIVWVTADCFMDHDIVLVPILSQVFDIHWIILLPTQHARYKESDFEEIQRNHNNISITYLYNQYRARYPQNLSYYLQIIKICKSVKPDFVYLDLWNDTPWILPFIWKLDKNNTILVVHQGKVHEGMSHKTLCNAVRCLGLNRLRFVKMYSQSQAALFKERFPKIDVFTFKLPIPDFGIPHKHRSHGETVRFLSFGVINHAKNIDLLIDAACQLYEQGQRGFKIVIKGGCQNWDFYQQHIKYPEIFETDIRFIDNDEIPDIFNDAHFFVQPYKVVSQSGPFKIALRYNVPLITSDLPGLKDEMQEGVTGWCFKTGSVQSLMEVMKKAIAQVPEQYGELREKEQEYVNSHYSTEAIINSHVKMFERMSQGSLKGKVPAISFKQWLKERSSVVFCRTMLQQVIEGIGVYRYAMTGRMHDTPIKLQTETAIAVHAIEKGMSIGNGRVGFGKEKASIILDDLQRLLNIGGDRVFVQHSIGTLKDYVEYNVNQGADMSAIFDKQKRFCQRNGMTDEPKRDGLIMLNRQDVMDEAHKNFGIFSQSRHSVRDFSDEPLDAEFVKKALKLSERTPSACNRQSWRIHVFFDKEKRERLFELQHGARGFYDKMQCAILICADLNYYNLSELNLAYVDGGLYGMNLLYALHYQGLAAIPLTMGIKQGVLKSIKKKIGIPMNEAPVLLIGIGTYKEKFKVASSHRESYTEYTKFDE